MIDVDKENRVRSAGQQLENAANSQASTGRRAYRTPHLRHLGSVRELTLGSIGPNSDEFAAQH
jgi:hypothetical protein